MLAAQLVNLDLGLGERDFRFFVAQIYLLAICAGLVQLWRVEVGVVDLCSPLAVVRLGLLPLDPVFFCLFGIDIATPARARSAAGSL